MKAALIFPPQWDPRQPPLAPAILARILQNSGADTKVFDLNIALYRHLLKSEFSGGIEDFLVKRLLDPQALGDAKSYVQTSEQIQKIFDERFDTKGTGRLFWDTCRGLPSVSASSDLLKTISSPDKIPFLSHLGTEIEPILEWKPNVIGISVISDTQLNAALSLAAYFRQFLPNSRIVLGGSAITYRRSILPGHNWFCSRIDAFCLGNGESLMSDLAEGKQLNQVSNALFWNDNGEVNHSISKIHIPSETCLPHFESLPMEQYLTPHLVMPVETARGCPWGACSFCIHPIKSAEARTTYHQKPLKIVENEIRYLFNLGHRRFFIVDEAIPPPRLIELSKLFSSLNEPVFWIGYIRLDEGHNLDSFIRARVSGCLKLFIGVESGSDRILTKFNKGTNSVSARRVLLDTAKAGIAVHFFLMTGFPGEEECDRRATLDLLSDVLPEFDPFGFSFDLFPLTGEMETDLMSNPASFGWKAPEINAGNDFAWQFPVMSGQAYAETLSNFKAEIHNLADNIYGKEFGLRHASIAQDSLHLLLLEARK